MSDTHQPHSPNGPPAILCADDYAMTEGVSAAIEELAAAERLSATSVLVTSRHWPAHAARIVGLRDRIAIALHLNLTLGEPAGPMPGLAPSGTFPSLGTVLRLALRRKLDAREIANEVSRQLDRFELHLGHPPDIVDGHQHVHALPQIRDAVLETLASRFPSAKPLVRDPSDSPLAILTRGAAPVKALGLSILTASFGSRARTLGFPTNQGFSGVSSFDEHVPYEDELARFFRDPGKRHLIMCHPGFPDAELARLDPVVQRRRAEFEALRDSLDLPERIAHLRREPDGRVTWMPWSTAHAPG